MKALGYDSREIEANLVVQPFSARKPYRNMRDVEYGIRFFVEDGVRRDDGKDAYVYEDVKINVYFRLSYDGMNNKWYDWTVERVLVGNAEIAADMFTFNLENVEKARPHLKRWEQYVKKMQPRTLRDYVDVAKKVYDTDRICNYIGLGKVEINEIDILQNVNAVDRDMRRHIRDIAAEDDRIAERLQDIALSI